MTELGCQQCGIYSKHEPCADCGQIVHIGEWPACPHGRAQSARGFQPYFDYGIGQYVTGVGDINKAMRPQWNGDYVTKLDHRDAPASQIREMNERRAERKANAEKERRHASK